MSTKCLYPSTACLAAASSHFASYSHPSDLWKLVCLLSTLKSIRLLYCSFNLLNSCMSHRRHFPLRNESSRQINCTDVYLAACLSVPFFSLLSCLPLCLPACLPALLCDCERLIACMPIHFGIHRLCNCAHFFLATRLKSFILFRAFLSTNMKYNLEVMHCKRPTATFC